MCISPITLKRFDKALNSYITYSVPCGNCLECERARCLEFSLRAVDEASLYPDNCCLTLTYNDKYLPENNNLCKRDLQLFIKRLRKKVGKVRYFGCGEYGSRFGRPHYHLILFGYAPPRNTAHYLYTKGQDYYHSSIFDNLWSIYQGNNSRGSPIFDPIGFVSFSYGLQQKTAFYCAKYLQKRVQRSDAVPAFTVQSTHPGLGAGILNDKMIEHPYIYRDGKKYNLPKYYARKLGIRRLRFGGKFLPYYIRLATVKLPVRLLKCNQEEKILQRERENEKYR